MGADLSKTGGLANMGLIFLPPSLPPSFWRQATSSSLWRLMTAPDPTALSAESEAACIKRAMLGEAADFARLVTAHYDRIYRLAYRFTGQRADAEDVAQEVCIKLAQNLGSYRFEAPFAIWLSRMVMNSARDCLRARTRKQSREVALFEDAELVQGGADPEQLAAARQGLRAVNRLGETLKEAVILVFGEGMSHAEAALALGCAESTVSWRIHEARKQLQAMDNSAQTGVQHERA